MATFGDPEDAQMNGINGATDPDTKMGGVEEAEDSRKPNVDEHGERQPNKERVTTPYLTKYERARILGTRALQIRSEYFHCALTDRVHELPPTV